MEKKLTFEELLELAEKRSYRALREALTEENEIDIAALMEELPEDDLAPVFRTLPKDMAAEVFANLSHELQEAIIESITDRELSAVVEELYVDDAVDLLEELPASVVERVLRAAKPETRSVINQFLNYPENSTGSIMTSEFVHLHRSMTVADAISYIRRSGDDSASLYTCYVTDASRVLEGVVTVRQLLLSEDTVCIADLMEENVISAQTTDDREQTAQLMMKYDLIAIPVVDGENRLVGIVTVDDVMDVLEEEATEDIEKMAAITPSDKPYLKTSVFDLWKSRVPWLLLLMVSATFTGMIITSFESALAAQVALTAFIPMLMDTGGNAGGQASVTVTRSLALGELEFKNLPVVVWKELRTALLCGGTLAVLNFGKVLLIDRVSVQIAAVVCLTLFATVCCAKLIGCTLPMLAKKLGFDPAVMASPLITTIVDAVSLSVYFGIASVLLGL